MIILSLGATSAAWATVPALGVNGGINGNGNSSSSVAPGQAKKDDGTATSSAASNNVVQSSSTTTSSSSTSGPGKSDQAPGHNKQDPQTNGSTSQGAGSSTTVSPAGAPDPNGPGTSDHSKGNASTTGSSTSPQPNSTADQNPGGANGQCLDPNHLGPYCSTRDGSPSLNGNGNGHAYGKPCAGCVGKADNKNPKGQRPNGSDHNAGYECDSNNGIGKTNPAHTGCTGSTPPPPTCQTNPNLPGCGHPNCKTNNTCPPPPNCHANGNCTPPGCTSNCTPPGCTSNCTPPGCTSHCTPPAHCATGQKMHNGSCVCIKGKMKNGSCVVIPPAVYVCPANSIMQSNGTCACPRGKTWMQTDNKCVGPQIKGIQKFRPRPNTQIPQVAPAAAGLPNTGADGGLGIFAMTGAGLLLAGGALMALRRKTARR